VELCPRKNGFSEIGAGKVRVSEDRFSPMRFLQIDIGQLGFWKLAVSQVGCLK
jgi:hypothetical protein